MSDVKELSITEEFGEHECSVCGTNCQLVSEMLDEKNKRIAQLERALKEETAIVDRIWDQLGRPSYEELKGRTIYDLIDELKAAAEQEGQPQQEKQELPKKRSCNRHDDCDKAEEELMARRGIKKHEISFSFHCHDDECEDCFGS